MAHYTCPFCNRDQAITPPKKDARVFRIDVQENAEGVIGVGYQALSCSNAKCLQTSVTVRLGPIVGLGQGVYNFSTDKPLYFYRNIRPGSSAKVFPDCIPEVLLEDYREACLIKDLSPKAAATLVRRCLQGMIRDFCQISDSTLAKEIAVLRKRLDEGKAPDGVSSESVDAIAHVKEIGNIGAHMERDINTIVSVDASEAEQLIGLVEMLFAEWYVDRHNRQSRLAALKNLHDDKKAQRTLGAPPEAK